MPDSLPHRQRASRRWLWWFLAASGLAPLIVLGGLVVWSWKKPETGLVEGRLRDCPASPNCVCSQSSDAAHLVAPFPCQGDADGAFLRLRGTVAGMPGAAIVEETPEYLRAEFTTRVLRFVDDVEFLLDRDAGVIHVRSASRVGRSDLGTNRRRVETIRTLWSAEVAGT